MSIDEQVSIMTEQELSLAVENIIDLIEDGEVEEVVDRHDVSEVARDLGYKPTPQLIDAVLYALDW